MKALDKRPKKAVLGNRSVLFGLALFISLFGCSAVNEKDLADLRSSNVIIEELAIRRISMAADSPGGLFDMFVSRTWEERAVEILAEILRSEKKSKVIELGSIKALGRLGKRIKIPVALLEGKLKNEDPEIRNQAIEALAMAKSREATRALLKSLEEDEDKILLIWALGEIGDAAAVPSLNKLSESEDVYVSYNTFRALAKIAAGQLGTEQNPDMSHSKGFLDAGRKTFEQYQDAMRAVFQAILGVKRS